MSRLALARRLSSLALQIAAGRPVRVRGAPVRVPERVVLEEELESQDGETELELEISWPAARRGR
jgi:amphi-Trp domain-containing protein